MPWGGHTGKICHGCGRHISECGRLSARYKCADCGEGAMLDNAFQLRAHNGPRFAHWRQRTLAAFGVAGVDERPDGA